MPNKQLFLDTYKRVLEKINPKRLVGRFIEDLDLKRYERIFVVGAGKGAALMAEAVEEKFGDLIKKGFIIIPEGESIPNLSKIEFVFGGHPFPNRNSVDGAYKILDICNNATEKDIIIALISGGGSSLMCLPVDDITLQDKIDTTKLLLANSIKINEINVIRKHLSKVKGGLLAKAAYPSPVLQLIISDVVNDDLGTIASGPFHQDDSNFADAVYILQKHKIWDQIPERVRNYLLNAEHETPTKVHKIKTSILANHKTAAEFAENYLKHHRCDAEIITTELEGDCDKRSNEILKKLVRGEKVYILAGETTVQIHGDGYGGRNQQFVLACINQLTAADNFIISAIGTDGVDGICPEKVAGAIADTDTLAIAAEKNLNLANYLENNNSYGFFKETDGLIITGPTGTNLGDLILMNLN